VQVIGHQHGGKNSPVLELTHRCFERVEGGGVCQDGFTISDANRDEVNHALSPWQPNTYSRWMAHAQSLVGAASAYNSFSLWGNLAEL
jgi:hypothetical protein